MRTLSIAVILLCASVAVHAADSDPKETPKNGNEMSLELYQKLKGHFETLYGAKTFLLPGVQPASKGDVEKALKEDAVANKDALVKALGSSAVIHRELAARALEYCGDKKLAVENLTKSVVNDVDDGVRRAAAAALAKLPDAAAVDALVKGLTDSAESVRGTCATALGNIKDPRASDPLLKLLASDSKPIPRMLAATALSKIKDPASAEGLKKALDAEKDERVKMALAGAVRSVMGGDSAKTEAVPTAGEAANELSGLAKEMKEVEQKLRDDRHDQAVQVQGTQIEQKLATLIQKLDKACNGSCDKPGEGKKEGQQQQQGNKSNGGKSSGNPLKDSSLGQATPPGSSNPALVAGKSDSWAKLPPAQRDELLQAFREEMPERWRKRLEAYFLSVAAEEAKDADK
jgi:hypothetical protein